MAWKSRNSGETPRVGSRATAASDDDVGRSPERSVDTGGLATTDQQVAPRRAPGPPARAVFRLLREFKKDQLGVFQRHWEKYGDVVGLRFGPIRAFLLVHPDAVEHVLHLNSRNYDKQIITYRRMRVLLGNGLVTSDGELWKRQRRIAQPAFDRSRVLSFGDLMVRAAVDVADLWAQHARNGTVFDVHEDMMRVALRVVGEALLGRIPLGEAKELGEALEIALVGFRQRLYSVQPLPLWIPTAGNVRMRRAVAILDRVVFDFIETRRSADSYPDDLLSRFLTARDPETGQAMDNRQLRDEVLTMFLAGHETSANALSWTWYLLARHPEQSRRLRCELDEILDGRDPTVDDLDRLPYCKAVFEESMRLYPPVWMVERRSRADDEIQRFHIPRNSILMLSQWLTHRHPEFWPQPDQFRPERFMGDAAKERPRYAYYPFAGGPRMCLGAAFAMQEAILILATLAQRFDLELAGSEAVEPEATITLRPRGGLPMRASLRR